MNRRFRIRALDLMVVVTLGGYILWSAASRSPTSTTPPSDFAQAVDMSQLSALAVQADGRLRSFDSHCKTFMSVVAGPRTIHGQSNSFTYLDLLFRPETYVDEDIVYVKNKQVRAQILDVLRGHEFVDDKRAALIKKRGLISRTLLSRPPVIALLRQLSQDLIRTGKSIDAIDAALTVADGRVLGSNLRLLPPPSGSRSDPWSSLDDVAATLSMPQDTAHAQVNRPNPIPGLDKAVQQELGGAWSALRTAWRAEDAESVNAAMAELASTLPTLTPELYPAAERLSLESWYFRWKSMTWVWLVYLACVVPLLMAIIYKWKRARTIGMALFFVAFTLQTASIGVRWYISGRWPNANMFEALTTSAWFGGVAAMVLEWITRRTAFRNIFALGSAVVSMAALMAGYFLPAALDSSIGNKMAALNDVWLYIHTNVIIWSYGIIGLACIPALLFLRHRWCTVWDSGHVPKFRLLVLPVALAVLNVTGYMLLMHVIARPTFGLSGSAMWGVGGAFWMSGMICVLELFAAKSRHEAGVRVERAAIGGAAALMGGGSGGHSFLQDDRPTASQVYDGATMVLVELAFIMLWTGVVMGAIWADHSWGRPWGWDPKEVFALNTFIIFLILIHVRLKVKDKGFWTAVIAVIGFEVMMFNWIVVNFIISGLHSYA